MLTYKFVDDKDEVVNSVLEFNKEANYYRELVGNNPHYFLHLEKGGRHFFGLSKFCAFKNITIAAYIREFRYATDGGKTQNHLRKIISQDWIEYSNSSEIIKLSFEKWVHSYFPKYKVIRAQFITIQSGQNLKKSCNLRQTQEELEKILELKKIIGSIGEEIAYQYEYNRISQLGAIDATKHITHTSLYDVNAGFDIFSDFDGEVRLIEVKSNVNGIGDIYITRNELQNFKLNTDKSYLYVVSITDLKKRRGKVEKIITNIEDLGKLEPILFKVIK
jgi:hypothetical protein